MTDYEKYSVLIQVIVAFGTIAVAVVAIRGEFLRSVFAAPRLNLRLYNPMGDPTKYNDGRNLRYYHLAVSNDRNWAPARNVVVHITLLERPGPDGEWRPQCIAVQFLWFGNLVSSTQVFHQSAE